MRRPPYSSFPNNNPSQLMVEGGVFRIHLAEVFRFFVPAAFPKEFATGGRRELCAVAIVILAAGKLINPKQLS